MNMILFQVSLNLDPVKDNLVSSVLGTRVSERNTENTMSHLYFSEESDYSEENKKVTMNSFSPPFSTLKRN